MSHLRNASIAIMSLILVVLSIPADASTYREDFRTTQYKDNLNTTAFWDTASGTLRLALFELTSVGSYDTPGEVWGISVEGDYAFITDYSYGIRVLNISDPSTPLPAGVCDTPGNARDIAVDGNYAYVADRSAGVQVIDISDPSSPTLVGGYDTVGSAVGIVTAGNYAYVAGGPSGLQVINITDPLIPALEGSCFTTSYAWGLAVAGDYAYVADASGGLAVVDITNPASPSLVTNFDTPGYSVDVAVAGNYAYVADRDSGLQVIDISDPEIPTFAARYDTPGEVWGICIEGDFAYIGDYNEGLKVLDISEPAHPVFAGSIDTPGNAVTITLAGEHAFVGNQYNGMHVVGVADVIGPVLHGSYDAPAQCYLTVVEGDYLFMADSTGFRVLNISDPANPTDAGSYGLPGSSSFSVQRGIAVAGDYAYVGSNDSGLVVLDISDPENPTRAGGGLGVAAFKDEAVIAGNYLYACMGNLFWAYDISDPVNPFIAGSLSSLWQGYGLAIEGDYAYVADGGGGLTVVNITTPTSPSVAGNYDEGTAYAWDVAVAGDYAFVTYGSSLYVFDVTDPTSPVKVASKAVGGEPRCVIISGNYAFISTALTITVVDISDPLNPVTAGSHATSGRSPALSLSGDYAYVTQTQWHLGVEVFKVFERSADPAGNLGRSLSIMPHSGAVRKIRLSTVEADSIRWSVSTNDGIDWQDLVPNGGWSDMLIPGSSLIWRSILTYDIDKPSLNPNCTSLEIGYLFDAALIDSIRDVPADQGGWVRVYFSRSAKDFDLETPQAQSYDVYRRVENAALQQALLDRAGQAGDHGADQWQGRWSMRQATAERIRRLEYEGRTYVLSEAGDVFPPGIWESAGSLGALQQDQYITLASTLADSMTSLMYTSYVIVTHTIEPSTWWVSPVDSGYSVDNIAPGVPQGFAVAYNTGSGNQLAWDQSPETDLQYYRIYRGSHENFIPDAATLVHETAAVVWSDPEYDGGAVYYKVAAVDHAGNESGPASPETLSAAETTLPHEFVLYQNVPNPFNPSTQIIYDVPGSGGTVTLRIYDVKGHLVRTLVDGTSTPGRKRVSWNGRNDSGIRAASGIYFYRMTAPGFTMTRKMILLK